MMYSDLKLSTLARLWARAARVYLEHRADCVAYMRYEDVVSSPLATVQAVIAASLPWLNAADLLHANKGLVMAIMDHQHQPKGNYLHSSQLNVTYTAAEVALVLNICGSEMAAFGYTAADTCVACQP
eukprot:5690155-Prymnesium_polylepis.1